MSAITRVRLFAPLFLALASLAGWAVYSPGCESIVPGMAEVRAVAEDARASSQAALDAAEASGDPEAIATAQDASRKADAALQQVQAVEAQALEWAEKIESGEITPEDGQSLGGMLGTLIAGPQGGVIGTIVGGTVFGWWYRRMAKQIIAGVDSAKAAVPALKDAFRLDGVADAVSAAVSPATWRFIETQRN